MVGARGLQNGETQDAGQGTKWTKWGAGVPSPSPGAGQSQTRWENEQGWVADTGICHRTQAGSMVSPGTPGGCVTTLLFNSQFTIH